MAPSRTRDRLAGAVVGALVTVLLLALAAGAAFLAVSRPADSAGRDDPSQAAPPSAGAAAGAPAADDLAAGETWLGDLVLDAGTLRTSETDLRDVRAVASGVLTGPGGTRAGRLDVDATVPFAVVAQQVGPGSTVAAADDGQASVRRTVEVLGRELEVVATGTVEVVDGRLVVEPRSVDVGGPAFLADAVGAVVRELVTIEQEVEGLPEGLVLREVTVTPDGFRARLDGEDVLVAP